MRGFGMFELTVRTHFAAAHILRGYPGKCSRPHGHNFGVHVTVEGPELGPVGMLMDFVELKRRVTALVDGELDHTDLNAHPAFAKDNPTAENIARFVYRQLAPDLPDGVSLQRVTIWESERASASYREDPNS